MSQEKPFSPIENSVERIPLVESHLSAACHDRSPSCRCGKINSLKEEEVLSRLSGSVEQKINDCDMKQMPISPDKLFLSKFVKTFQRRLKVVKPKRVLRSMASRKRCLTEEIKNHPLEHNQESFLGALGLTKVLRKPSSIEGELELLMSQRIISKREMLKILDLPDSAKKYLMIFLQEKSRKMTREN